jgi:hypothetical protein
MKLVINEHNCNGEGYEFWGWMSTRHPEVDVDFREGVSGVGGGVFDDDGVELAIDFWDEYCNDGGAK